MLDQSLVQSGFDAEILLGERQLTAVLLTLIDAGRISASFVVRGISVTLLMPIVIDRTYDPDPAAPFLDTASDDLNPFQVELLFDHPTGADIRVHLVVLVNVGIDLFVELAPEVDRDTAGTLESARLKVTVLDYEIDVPGLEESFQTTKAKVLADIKAEVDRTVDLGGVGTFNRIQDLAIQKLPADAEHASAFGIYVNLRLQTGPEPESLMPTRGDLLAARNFLPAGSDSAMASRADIYNDIAIDAFNRFAEIDENGNVSHPWRKSPFNKTSEIVGKIRGVLVAPIPNSKTLKIKVRAEREWDNFFNPNVSIDVELTPSTTAVGTLKWDVNVDFQGSVLVELISFAVLAAAFTGIFAAAGMGASAAIALGFMSGSVGHSAGHLIIDELRSGRIERKIDAGLPDVISGRVEVTQRRWDPLYTTHHQVAMRPDGALINEFGIVLWGRAVLDREFAPVAHAVIRDKRVARPHPPTHLRYRVSDAGDFLEDYTAIAPATDRREFSQHDPTGEPTFFELSIEQIVDRIAEKRIVPEIAYIAKRVHMEQNQVDGILVFSRREQGDAPAAFAREFAAERRAEITVNESDEIRSEIEAELAENGFTATPEQLDVLVAAKIEARVVELVEGLVNGPGFEAKVEAWLQPLMRFDLPPEHFAALQKQKILHLIGLEIITMRAPGHEGFMYYRDRPDFDPRDNLHERPRYRQTPDGPEIL